MAMSVTASFVQRLLLPGLAFKAVVIGGGYATGRELAEFFLPSGPRGGLLGLLLSMVLWSVICTLTFLFARLTNSLDYRTFFQKLLGPFWISYEIAYFAFIVLLLSVFGAAAGELGKAVFGWPTSAGTLCLVAGIAFFVSYGNDSVERLFKYVSFFLYAVYGVFLLLAFLRFGNRISHSFAVDVPIDGWASGAITYTGYNIIGAVVILPVLRHMTSRKDAVIAGMLCGPLAMIPAIIFFICMAAYYPQIGGEALPSNFLLERIDLRGFQIVFQLMVFAALLESGSGAIHAINERVASAYAARHARPLSPKARLGVTGVLLFVSLFLAGRFGFVALIAKGYGTLAYVFLAIYVVPLLTYASYRIFTAMAKDEVS